MKRPLGIDDSSGTAMGLKLKMSTVFDLEVVVVVLVELWTDIGHHRLVKQVPLTETRVEAHVFELLYSMFPGDLVTGDQPIHERMDLGLHCFDLFVLEDSVVPLR